MNRTNNSGADLAGFHGVYWIITGAAIASFVISLMIKHHSMDKHLGSKFVLQGAKGPVQVAPVTAAASTPAWPDLEAQDGSMIGTPIFKGSAATCGRIPSGFDTESTSTYSAAKQSQDGPLDDRGNSPDDINSAEFVEEIAAVAYYIEPGGRIIPVDILADSRPGSQAASIREVEKPGQETRLAPLGLWPGRPVPNHCSPTSTPLGG